MNTIAVSKFKATCLEVLEQVHATGQPVRITQRGKPLAEVTPPSGGKAPIKKRADGMGSMAHCTKIKGDITVPSSELVRWEILDE